MSKKKLLEFGLKEADAFQKNFKIIFDRLVRGYKSMMGKEPEGLDLLKVKMEAREKALNTTKVVNQKGLTLDPDKPIVGGTQEGIETIQIKELDDFNLSKDDPMGDLEKIVKGEGDTGLPKQEAPQGVKTILEEELGVKLYGDETFDELMIIKNTGKHPRDLADGGRVAFRGGGMDASSDDFGGSTSNDQGETSSDSGFGGSSNNNNNNNNNNNDNNAPDTGGHSRFDVGSGYYGETVTDSGGSGDTITNKPETYYDDEITRKSPIERVKTNYNIRKDDFVKTQRKDALMFMAKTAFMGIGPIGMYNFAKKQNVKKTDYINSVKKDIDKLKDLGVPEYNPHTDTLIQTLEQDILDLTQPKDKEEDKGDNDAPVTELIAASTETIEDRDETDIFDVWDRIKAGQAKRAMLKESGIIQDNTQEETMMLNSGGLANLFRVKTQ